jgi:hypothetical protein
VKLLEAEPTVAPEVAPEAPQETPPEHPPSLPEAVPTCKACGAPMEPEQDWCLTCGAAAPGSLGQRPGLRAVSTIGALTVALVLGAVAAGYAALHDNGNKPAQQASVPAAAAPVPQQAAPTPPATQTPAPTQSTPTQSTPTQSTPSTSSSSTLPKITTPSTSTPQGTPITPLPPTTPSTSTPSTSTPSTSTPSTSTPSTSTPTTSTPTTTTPAGPQPIDIKSDAGTVYDPYGRAKATGQTPRALDGDASTSWYVDPKDPQSIGVGYAVNLGKLQGIREVDLDTTTPGFKIEVYATDEPQVPPDILDTRWSHITNVSKVGVKDDGKEKIVLGAGTTKYRNLLLWFTTPPTDGSRLRIVDLKILG